MLQEKHCFGNFQPYYSASQGNFPRVWNSCRILEKGGFQMSEKELSMQGMPKYYSTKLLRAVARFLAKSFWLEEKNPLHTALRHRRLPNEHSCNQSNLRRISKSRKNTLLQACKQGSCGIKPFP